MRLAIVGLGAIGLPIAVELAGRGHQVIGCDISQVVVDAVSKGQDPHGHEPGLDKALADVVASGRLRATTDTTAGVSGCEATIVLVPLVTDDRRQPDYSAIDSATKAIGRGLKAGHLVVYETTLPVGDTRTRFAPILAKASGLTVGVDLFVAFSPERVLVGRIRDDLRRYPKLVGGLDDASTRRAVELYRASLGAEVRAMSTCEVAEFTKLAETTYRSVNIGLANEFAEYCEASGLDLIEAIAAANTHPYSHIHDPGIGVGGHCIPVYPHFYLRGANGGVVTSAALAVNEEAPARCVRRLRGALGGLQGKHVLVLGWGYRAGNADARYSVAREIAARLSDQGAFVSGHDPLIGRDQIESLGFRYLDPWARPAVHAVLLQAGHREYTGLRPEMFPGCQVLLDGRNFLAAEEWAAAGITVLRVGRPAYGGTNKDAP